MKWIVNSKVSEWNLIIEKNNDKVSYKKNGYWME